MRIPKVSKRIQGAIAATSSIFLLGWLGAYALPRPNLLPISASAEAKRDQLWSRVERTAYRPGFLPTEGPGALDLAKLLYTPFLQVTFLHTSDEMPLGRKRVIHTFGSIAKVRFETLPGVPFTGLFESGGIGLIRLSLAAQGGTFTPGFGLKILVSGQPSVNFQAMYSLDGQGEDHNFFAHRFSNIVAPPESFALKVGAQAFAAAIHSLPGAPENERTLPLEEAAAIRADGATVAHVIAPYEIEFWPTKAAASFTPSQDDLDVRERLAAIPMGTQLYEVTARDRQGNRSGVGRIVTDSPIIASQYGDETIFFQHQSRLH